jgi:hypothetical protein
VIWHVSGRLQVRARDVYNIPFSGCLYIPFFFNMIAVAGGGTNAMGVSKKIGPGDVHGVLRDFKFAALAEGSFFLSRGLQQTFAKYYFNNPAHVTLPRSSVSSRSRRIRKLLPQLCVCVSRLVMMVCIWYTRSLGRLNFLISCFATTR